MPKPPLILVIFVAAVAILGAGCGSRPDGVTRQFYESLVALDLNAMSRFVCEDERAEFRSAMGFLASTPDTGFRLEDFEAQTETSDGTSATIKVSARIRDSEGSDIPLSGRVRLLRDRGEWCISGERDGFRSLLSIAEGVFESSTNGWIGHEPVYNAGGEEWIIAEVNPVTRSGPPPITGEIVTTRSGLQYIDIRAGPGTQPQPWQTLVVHYTLWLKESGKRMDSSRDRGVPFEFVLGSDLVVDGFDEGLATMRQGGERRLLVPPRLGYGDDDDYADIPPNSTLVFDVELVEVR